MAKTSDGCTKAESRAFAMIPFPAARMGPNRRRRSQVAFRKWSRWLNSWLVWQRRLGEEWRQELRKECGICPTTSKP